MVGVRKTEIPHSIKDLISSLEGGGGGGGLGSGLYLGAM